MKTSKSYHLWVFRMFYSNKQVYRYRTDTTDLSYKLHLIALPLPLKDYFEKPLISS